MHTLPALVFEWILIVFVAGVGFIVLMKLWSGAIDLSGLLSEVPTVVPPAPPAAAPAPVPPGPPGAPAAVIAKASMSRLQLLLFTFVIVGLYVTLSFEAGAMVEIPNQVLGLLGISGGSYVLSKGIQLNQS
jgi:hypothetical protein